MKKFISRVYGLLYAPKISLKMKLTYMLIFLALFQIQANSTYSQNTKVTLDCKSMQIGDILNEIEHKTDFKFLYEDDILKKDKIVSLSAKEEILFDVLNRLFRNDDIGFKVVDKQIILTPRASMSLQNDPSLFYSAKRHLSALLKQLKVNGQITDENGEPLPGASVIVKGSKEGASSDINGNYSISIAQDSKVLLVSYIGYETTEVIINNRSTINVQLKTAVTSLDEFVIIGYGSAKKKDLTGSVGTVDVANIANQSPTISLDNALQGQVAGVYVSGATGQPGAAARVRIRGTTSLLGSNQPLYVIDGIPVVPDSNIPLGDKEGQRLGDDLAREGISTPIGNISTSDIESISILKDASASAIYGSRAANGVIIITTKQGVYSGAPKFEFNASSSIQFAQTLDVLNASQFKDLWTTAVENGTRNDAFAKSVLDGTYFGNADTNWEDEISPGNPLTSTYNLNVYGGSEKTRYSTSLGVNTQEGIYKNTGFDRYTLNLSLNTKLSARWTFGTKLNLSTADQESVDGELTQLTYAFRPDLPVFDEDGNYSFSSQFNSENPVARSKGTNSNNTFLVLGSIFTELEILKDLKFKTLFSINSNNGNQKSFYPSFTAIGGWSTLTGEGDGYAQESRSRYTNTLLQSTLTYDKFIGNHDINAVAGASFEKTKNSYVKVWGEGFFNDVLTNVSSATIFTDASAYETGSGLASYFGRVNYGYDSRYLLTLSARVDGSSKFAKDNQYAFFPAAAVAWRVSNESFLENSKVIDDLKFRASLGTTGQQDFGDYAWRTLFETADYGPDPSIIVTQLGNDKLKWETTDQLDLGVDFSLFGGRLSGGVGYYTKTTKDALFTAITPGSTGYSTIIANIGNTENKGVELELKANIIRTDDFNWNLSFNVSKNKNKLTKISDDFRDDEGFLSGFPGGGRLREGSPIGLIYGYVAEGIIQSQGEIDILNAGSSNGIYQDDETAPGDLRFKDLTGPNGVPDGMITNLDQQVIGDTQPDFFGGINNTLSYKGFTLSTFFTFSIGNDLEAFGLARDSNFANTFIGENKVTSVVNAWTPNNTNTNIPRVVYFDPNNNDRTSSHYVYDASYLRLKTLNLNYSFSQTLIDQIKIFDSLSIYMTAQNLFTITSYPGADPEASNLYNNDISAGRDNNRFPIAKVFTAGVKVGF